MPEIVAEFTTNHFGHAGLLRRMVEEAADAGADAIKMQAKDVATYYSCAKLAAPFCSPFGKTYREYRSLFELSCDDWANYADWCHAVGVPWFCTAQDEVSLSWVRPWLSWGGLKRVKVASSNARNTAFLDALQTKVWTAYEIVVSVAGSTLAEVEEVVKRFRDYQRLYILHCVAEYPCPPERLRLGNIVELKARFETERVRIGYSGHEMGYQPTIAAVRLGAEMIERHFCISRHSFVHHIECSLEPDEFAAMVRTARNGTLPVGVPDEAYESNFGMSKKEEAFLVQQTYGQKLMGQKSVMGET